MAKMEGLTADARSVRARVEAQHSANPILKILDYADHLAKHEHFDMAHELVKIAEVLEKGSKNKKKYTEGLSDKKYVDRIANYGKKLLGVDETPRTPTAKEIGKKHGVHEDDVTDDMKQASGWKMYGKHVDRDPESNIPSVTPPKPNKKGKSAKLDVNWERKPEIQQDPTTGKTSISHLGSKKSLRHEVAHYIRGNKGIVGLAQAMDRGFSHIKTLAGKARKSGRKDVANPEQLKNQFAHPGEVETMGIENKVARRAGVAPERSSISSKSIPTGEKTKKGKPKMKSVPKTAEDPVATSMSGDPSKTGKPIHKLIPSKDGKGRHITHLSSNVPDKLNTKMDMIDNGEIKFNKDKGWERSESIDARINGRAAGRRDIKDDAKVKKLPTKSDPAKLAASEAGKEVKSLLKSILAKVQKV